MGLKKGVMSYEQFEGREESHQPPPAVVSGQDSKNVCGLQAPAFTALPHPRNPGILGSRVSTCLSLMATEIRGLCSAQRSACCSGSRKGLSCLGLSFSPSPFWWPSCVAAEVAFSGYPGMEPRAGEPVPGDTFRDTEDSRILHCVGSTFSSLLFWHIVRLGVFFCPAGSPFGVGMEGKFAPVLQPKSGILVLMLASRVALGKPPPLSGPQVPHL